MPLSTYNTLFNLIVLWSWPTVKCGLKFPHNQWHPGRGLLMKGGRCVTIMPPKRNVIHPPFNVFTTKTILSHKRNVVYSLPKHYKN